MDGHLPPPSKRTWLPIAVVLATALASAALSRRGDLSPLALRPPPPAEAAPASEPAAPQAEASAETPAVVAPAPADPLRGRWELMTSRLEREARRFPGRIAVYTKDLKRGWEWGFHADDLFPSASLIKVPVMIGVFDKIKGGEMSLSQQLMLKRRLRAGGSGSLKWCRDGVKLTVRQLLDHLIHESDNTAMRILIDEVGIGYLQRQFQRMGLVYTEIYPEGLSLSSSRVRYENFTTAREMSMLLDKIYRREMVDKFSSELMLDILKQRRTPSRLAKALPAGWEIAHKTGLLRRACHDAAIVFSPEGDYILTVLTGQNSDYTSAKDYISKIGQITYMDYKGRVDLYAKASRDPHGQSR
ncbi:MAG: serine hydrolase [Elusimicrobia bacterium]|nr:serine hydrolase [Elusimicrobiota bacterium]